MPAPSRAAARNAQVRAALRARFPGVRFSVRNGCSGSVAVTWADGPTSTTVGGLIQSVRADVPGHWAYSLARSFTAEAIAVAYLRQHAAGNRDFYWEAGTGEPRRPGNVLASWNCPHEHLDATTITGDERAQAAMTIALASTDPHWIPDQPARALARTVHQLAPVIAAATA